MYLFLGNEPVFISVKSVVSFLRESVHWAARGRQSKRMKKVQRGFLAYKRKEENGSFGCNAMHGLTLTMTSFPAG